MSAISGLSGSSAANNASGRFAELTSEEFIKVMLAELTQQDPLEPSDSSKLLEQFSSLRNIESQLQLQQGLENLVTQNQISIASGMIGKVVQGLGANDTAVTGQVVSVRVIDGQARLELDTAQTLPIDRVTRVMSASNG